MCLPRLAPALRSSGPDAGGEELETAPKVRVGAREFISGGHERRARTSSWAVVGMLARTVDRLDALLLVRFFSRVCAPLLLPLSITRARSLSLSLSLAYFSRSRALSWGAVRFFGATAKRWGQQVGLLHSSFFSLSLPLSPTFPPTHGRTHSSSLPPSLVRSFSDPLLLCLPLPPPLSLPLCPLCHDRVRVQESSASRAGPPRALHMRWC